MACSRLGSRVLEAVWNSASVSHRQNIAQELGNNHHTKGWLDFIMIILICLSVPRVHVPVSDPLSHLYFFFSGQ